MKKNIQVATILFIILISNMLNAQSSKDSELFNLIKTKDSLMFEVGFNQCDMTQFDQLLPEKFEFYHDKDGIITSKDVFISNLRKNLCSTGKNSTQRILVEGSMEVYPLYDEGELYGALQMGIHQFGNTTAKFTHLWLKKKGEWMPSRMISYDHKMAEISKIVDVTFIQLSSTEMAVYLGDYQFSPDFTLSIIQEKGKLYGDAQGEKAEIKPYGNHQFLDDSQTMKLRFTTNKAGNITGLIMVSPDGEMSAQKVK